MRPSAKRTVTTTSPGRTRGPNMNANVPPARENVPVRGAPAGPLTLIDVTSAPAAPQTSSRGGVFTQKPDPKRSSGRRPDWRARRRISKNTPRERRASPSRPQAAGLCAGSRRSRAGRTDTHRRGSPPDRAAFDAPCPAAVGIGEHERRDSERMAFDVAVDEAQPDDDREILG